jgi:hypothetical protein
MRSHMRASVSRRSVVAIAASACALSDEGSAAARAWPVVPHR